MLTLVFKFSELNPQFFKVSDFASSACNTVMESLLSAVSSRCGERKP
jgi:hypothetical protein